MNPVDLALPECPAPVLRPGAIGIDHVEVTDDPPAIAVTFLLPPGVSLAGAGLLSRGVYVLTGGARIFPTVVGVAAAPGRSSEVVLNLDQAGDFSIYHLTVTAPGLDPFFAQAEARFRVKCETPFDCAAPAPPAPSPPQADVPIDYLAKDYASFRQGLLDFVAARLPEWTERSEADVGIVLLELLAATGDSLSYLQDRVAGEAFLGTAAQRRSVQGHLALLGYWMDNGASAATWLQFQVARRWLLPAGLTVTTPPQPAPGPVFETIEERVLEPEQNEMPLFTWGNRACQVARTATSLALVGTFDTLQAGDRVVIADTGSAACDVVRLVAPPQTVPPDPVAADPDGPITIIQWSAATPLHYDYPVQSTVVRGNLVAATHGETLEEVHDLAGGQGTPVSESALVVPPAGPVGRTYLVSAFGFIPSPPEPLSFVVRSPDGSVLGDDTKLKVQNEFGGLADEPVAVPAGVQAGIWSAECTGTASGRRSVARWEVRPAGEPASPPAPRPRLRLRLAEAPLTVLPAPAAAAADGVGEPGPPVSPGQTPPGVPQVTLTVDDRPWQLRTTLLGSGPDDEVYAIETDDDGTARLVFGQGGDAGASGDQSGRRPPDGARLAVRYRVGSGAAGNLGAGTLTHAPGADPDWLIGVTNPLPAEGGRDPESREHARLAGPASIGNRLVAVTAADYEDAAAQVVDENGSKLVSRAGVTFRWTGSWLTVNVVVDPAGQIGLEPATAARILGDLDRRRLVGYDLQLQEPQYVPLQLHLRICVAAGFVATDVESSLHLALRPPGGFFSPDNFTFGTAVDIGALFAAVSAVPGVEAATVQTLAPLHARDPAAVTAAVRRLGWLELAADQVAQLDDDPNFPERGQLRLTMVGGR
jgi:hypothetical protein